MRGEHLELRQCRKFCFEFARPDFCAIYLPSGFSGLKRFPSFFRGRNRFVVKETGRELFKKYPPPPRHKHLILNFDSEQISQRTPPGHTFRRTMLNCFTRLVTHTCRTLRIKDNQPPPPVMITGIRSEFSTTP